MPIFEIFVAAAPEVLGVAEGAAALGTLGVGAEAAGLLGAGAEAAGGLGALGLGAGAELAPEILADPNLLANLVQEKAMQSGIMQAANPGLMQSVANFAPETSMFGPGSEQLAANNGFNLGQQAVQNYATNFAPTPEMGPGVPQITPETYEFPTPNQIGNYPGGSTAPTTLDANTFPTPNQAGFQPGGSTEPTVSNFRNANEIRGTSDNPLMRGLDYAKNWIKENPWQAVAGAGYLGSKLGGSSGVQAPDTTYNGPLSKYKLSSDFQGQQANPQNFQYTPTQYKYAEGGITDIEAPTSHGVGIYRDTDPDTMYLDPLTAAMVRQSKLESRSHVNTPAKFKKPTPMGTLNFKPVAAAQGGIMDASNLGSYAAGGNPRLLRGPGDGMSDNIPATINNRQPARLADGEFVIPADVVSHLGNGSTEAGAEKLHEMMTEVRKARTGNPKQGKEINPHKYMPK